MKFTLTSITEQGVMAKEDNQIQLSYSDYLMPEDGASDGMLESIEADMDLKWQEAEANRKEYEIAKTEIIDMTIIEGDFDYRIGNQGISYGTELGDRIEGDIKTMGRWRTGNAALRGDQIVIGRL